MTKIESKLIAFARCVECGKCITRVDAETQLAHLHYVPDSAYSTEVYEWTCGSCALKLTQISK